MQARFLRTRGMVARWLGVEFAGFTEIHLVEDLERLRRDSGYRGGEWVVGLSAPPERIFVRLDKITARVALHVVLTHETVHHVLAALPHKDLPRWFEEGLCIFRAGESYFDPEIRLPRLAAGGGLPSFQEIDAYFEGNESEVAIAYAYGESAVAWFFQRFGDERMRRLLAEVARGLAFPEAFRAATGADLADFERRWRESVDPNVPLALYLLLEHIDLTLLVAGALLVAGGYLRWRLRRERAMAALDRGLNPPPAPGSPPSGAA